MSKPLYFTALLCFSLCIAYSLIISHDFVHGVDLDTLGWRVVAQYSVASILMLYIWIRFPNSGDGFSPVWSLLLVGVLVRLLLLVTEPYTSNDVSRYLFDGRIALQGFDPYSTPHNHPELVSLRELWAPPDEHAKYVTLYPPLALSLFSLAASFGPLKAIWAWKIITLFASLIVLWLGFKVLERAGKIQNLPLLALSPLLILEAGSGLHLDIVTAAAVLAAVYSWQSKNIALVGVFIGIGGLLKILPMVLLLPFFVMLNQWRPRIRLVITALAVWLSGYLIFFLIGFKPIGSLAVFFEKWRSGSALFLWLEPHLGQPAMLFLALSVTALGFILIAAYLWREKLKVTNVESVQGIERVESTKDRELRMQDSMFLAMQFSMAIPLLVSPVIFPWYLLPILCLLALRPNLLIILWSLSIPLLYEVLGQFACCNVWAPATWPIHIIGIGLILAIFISVTSRIMNTRNSHAP